MGRWYVGIASFLPLKLVYGLDFDVRRQNLGSLEHTSHPMDKDPYRVVHFPKYY